MPKKPISSCPHTLPQSVSHISTAEWTTGFLIYYAQERDLVKAALESTLEALNVPPSQRPPIWEQAKAELKGRGNDPVGVLGEAHLSYHLEVRKSIRLTRAGWKSDPFNVAKGIDLVGVDTKQWRVCLTESKASELNTSSSKSSVLSKLRNQLRLERTEAKFLRDSGEDTLKAAVAAILKHLRKSGVPAESMPRVDTTSYHRIGGVIVSQETPWNPIVNACPCDVQPHRSCELVLLVVEDLPAKLVAITLTEGTSNTLGSKQ